MSIFNHPEFNHHEQIVFCHDKASGLQAIIAVHNTHRGPALGGCRMWPYESTQEAIKDVLRLSTGMTYKSALANLPLGGGKAVIIGDPRKDKTPALLMALGGFIEKMSGKYITAEDSGTSVNDIATIGKTTQFVSGIAENSAEGGDPSPSTALGTFVGLKAAVKHQLNTDNLNGLRIAIQGMGNVGFRLAKQLSEAGAQLIVTDIYTENVDRAVKELGATAVKPHEIYRVDADVFSPCAMGGIINDETIEELKVSVIAGAANNQLATEEHGHLLAERNILYAPDYVINAGGIIDIAYQRSGAGEQAMLRHIENIGTTLDEIFTRASATNASTHRIANLMAEERFQ